ncbi:MAG: hypothetical protein AAB727_02005 [Patescibacteria group bacterium]
MAEFRTSFIPKKPIGAAPQEEKRGINLVLFVSLVIFLGTLLVLISLFAYQVYLKQQETALADSVKRAKEAVEPALVESLERIDSRVASAEGILTNHLIVSPVLRLLQMQTLQSVAFENFNYTVEPDGSIVLRLTGEARNYSSVALQSVIFGENTFIKNALFSNFQLSTRGNVVFNFTANIDKRLVLYSSALTAGF